MTQQVVPGQRFGRLVVIDVDARVTYSGSSRYAYRAARCRCDCGTERIARLSTLLLGRVKSCGCLAADKKRNFGRTPAAAKGSAVSASRKRNPKALSKQPFYAAWRHMLARTEDPGNKSYKWYGARGISVCEAWHDPWAFFAWVEANLGPRPAGCSLDRIDNDGNYEPGNVRWATASQQAQNQRRRRNPPKPKRPTVAVLLAEVERLNGRIAELEAQLAQAS